LSWIKALSWRKVR
ncbi:putative methyl-accepting chemotaxis domain protein, partial [Vibrio parahaemolyticus V-223/04]